MGSSKDRKEAEEATAVAVTKKDKKEKKEKKEKKRSETDGVHKSKDKSDKKEKKQKKEKLVQALDAHLQAEAAKAQDEAASATANVEMTDAASKPKKAARAARPIVQGALVEFAKPLATDKYQKKVFKAIKKAAQNQALLRGIKEVNKALRKSPAKTPTTSGTAKISGAGAVPGIVVIAGDVNPAEVIMHLPLACEDVNVPYVFVASRGELGQAARTKRPTSVVMLKAEGRPAKKDKVATVAESDDEEAGNSYPELYQELVKLTQKEYATQMAGIV